MNEVVLKMLIVLIAFLTAFLVYYHIVEPYILRPNCLTCTDGCVKIKYYKFQNSVLFNSIATGYWVWFDGNQTFVYGQPIGPVCNDMKDKDPAYRVDPVSGLPHGYECIHSLNKVLDFYKGYNVKPQYLYVRKDIDTFNVKDALNLLQKERIIDLSQITKPIFG